MSTDAYTPVQTSQRVLAAAHHKLTQPYQNTLLRNFMGGCMIGMGGMFYIIASGGAAELTAEDPGLTKLIASSLFPVALIFIILTGAELITSNIMYMTLLLLERKINILQLLINWVLSYIGNLMGCLWFAGIFCFYGQLATTAPYKAATLVLVQHKIIEPSWHVIFIRAIGCNWLVALACWLGASSKDNISKIVSIHLPVWLFVAVGFEHIVADMFFIPLGMMNGAPLSVGTFVIKGMIPITMGNILGGAIFVACNHWYLDVFCERRNESSHLAGHDVGYDVENKHVTVRETSV